MSAHYLSKSAFKVARSCPTKLFYYRSKYASLLSSDPYLQFLADGGHIVGKLAQLLYPEGVLITGDTADAVARTAEALKKDQVTLFEAAFICANKLVRVDVLQKRGKSVKLIEVKSKSFDSDKEEDFRSEGKRTTFRSGKGTFDAGWRPYLEDICYQVYVASLAYPEFEFIPYLLLADKAKKTTSDCVASMFHIEERNSNTPGRREFEVVFTGDASKLADCQFMTLVNVEEEVELLWDEVRTAAEEFDRNLTPKLVKIHTPLHRGCSSCEYRVKPGVKTEEKDGFRECWGDLAETDHHIFELYYGGTIQQGDLFDSLIASRKVSLFDVPTGILSGKRGDRQLVQIRHTRAQTEWFSDELDSIIRSVQYPLHFVDFETSRLPIPYHDGMRPYDQIAFQWSCHTIEKPGAAPKASAWINTEDHFPNFQFAHELREKIGSKGSVLTWAHHESSVLKDIKRQIGEYGKKDLELEEWIDELCREDGRILDLNQVTLKNYFHPEMKGKTSLKAVLPAVWNNNPALHQLPWLKEYVAYEDGSKVLDPYKTLSKIEIAGRAETVQEGTGAMRAYQHMVYGTGRNAGSEAKEAWRRLLLQYCALDTIAMVVVWTYWEKSLGIRSYPTTGGEVIDGHTSFSQASTSSSG